MDQFKRDYPISLAGAQNVYQIISAKPVDSPFTLRRTVVKAFEAFDANLKMAVAKSWWQRVCDVR